MTRLRQHRELASVQLERSVFTGEALLLHHRPHGCGEDRDLALPGDGPHCHRRGETNERSNGSQIGEAFTDGLMYVDVDAQDCRWEQVNPKAITADELYGTIEKAVLLLLFLFTVSLTPQRF